MKFPENNIQRWVIFAFDVFATLFALFVAYALRFDFFSSKQDFTNEMEMLKLALPIFIGVRILLFYFGKTYAGIIRYTSTEDAKRIFKVVSIGTGIFIILSTLKFYFYDDKYFLPRPIIAIEYVLTLVFMIATRLAVKLIYHEGKKDKGNTKNVIIYGAGEMGSIVYRTFNESANITQNVVAFVDDNPGKSGNILQGVKVFHTSKLEELIEKENIDNIIVSIQNPSNEKRSKVLDIALNNDVTVLNVPPVESWIDGQINVKQIQKIRIEDILGRKEISLSMDTISQSTKGETILVTGAAGSIGSEMVRQLLRFSPKKIILLDQAESGLYDLEQELIEYADSMEIVVGDIANLSRIEKVFSFFKPALVFHAAAYKHVPLMEENPCEAIETNVQGTKNLVDLSDKYKVQKFVMVSTDKAVNPTNVMGASKRIAEIIAQHKNGNSATAFITTRFGNVLGSNGSVIPLFRRQIEKGGPLTVTHEEVTRFFMTIPEACQLVIEAGIMGEGGEIFVFDMGESVKIIDLARRVIKLSGFEPEVDIKIKITGLRPGEKLYEEVLSDGETTMPTHHPQILIGKTREVEPNIEEDVIQLIDFSNQQENELVVKKMKKIIPEFLSNNSVYDKLDTK
ncbi:MAG: nucleoside-diphosphate sugar epimerase/dehydratase [Flavobacteriales bacterium]